MISNEPDDDTPAAPDNDEDREIDARYDNESDSDLVRENSIRRRHHEIG